MQERGDGAEAVENKPIPISDEDFDESIRVLSQFGSVSVGPELIALLRQPHNTPWRVEQVCDTVIARGADNPMAMALSMLRVMPQQPVRSKESKEAPVAAKDAPVPGLPPPPPPPVKPATVVFRGLPQEQRDGYLAQAKERYPHVRAEAAIEGLAVNVWMHEVWKQEMERQRKEKEEHERRNERSA